MRNLRVFVLIVMFGLAVCGCRKKDVDSENGKTTEEKMRKEAVMDITIQWLGHASFRICHEDKVIYIDPWKLKESAAAAAGLSRSQSNEQQG